MIYAEFVLIAERMGAAAEGDDNFDRWGIEQFIYEYVNEKEAVGAEAVTLAVAATLSYVSGYIHERGHYSLAEEIGADIE